MSAFDLDSLTKQLAKTSVVVSGVSFEGRKLKLDTEDDAKEVVEAISACSDLQFLNLEGNTLGVDAAKAVAKSLESHPELKRALWKDMFTGRMKSEIPKALQFLGSGLVLAGVRLVELQLSDNAFGPIGVEGLAVLLKSPVCYALQELRLNNNGLGTAGGKMVASGLMDCYELSKKEGKPLALRVFVAGRNRLETEATKELARVFKTLGSLEELAMPQNGIYNIGISALADALTHNQNLQVLNLNDNTFGEKGAAAMASALPYIQHLKEVNFGDCLLKTKGAILIAEALAIGHQHLEIVQLGFNEIRSKGGVFIAQAMRNKTKLKELVLDGNQFGAEGKELIHSELLSSGRMDALGSLSEDEGEDEDEEQAEEEEEEDEGENDVEEEEEEEENGEEVDYEEGYIEEVVMPHIDIQARNGEQHPHLDVSNEVEEVQNENNLELMQCSVADFLESPTPERFLGIGSDRDSLLLAEIKAFSKERYVEQVMQVLMKVSAITACNLAAAKAAALETSDVLYGELFRWAQQEEELSVVNNYLMVYLGLIKGEDKKLVLNWNLEGCMVGLTHIIPKEYFPQDTRNVLQVFLGRPNLKVDDFPITKHKLMQVLFQY